MMPQTALKTDGFGAIRTDGERVFRDTNAARPAVRWLARRLAAREAAALEALAGLDGLPQLLGFDGRVLQRSFLPGAPLHIAQPRSREFFSRALRLVIAMHRRGVVHRDLGKEANWLVMPDGRPAIVDFQVALVARRRGRLFRALAHVDLRHWLKHKRTYAPEALTARQRRLLASPSWPTRFWRSFVKPVYLAITRGVLGWPEREGPIERAR